MRDYERLETEDDAVDFAVVECVNGTFEEVCGRLRDEPAVTFGAVAGSRATELQAEAGRLVVVGPEIAVLRAAWRDRAGLPRLEAEIRVVGINRGAEPITELLMIGHGSTSDGKRSGVLAWAHGVLAELADNPRPAVGAVHADQTTT